MKPTSVVLSICAALCVAVETAVDLRASQTLSMSLRMTEQITLHEPVVFAYAVTNNSTQDAWLSAGFDRLGAFEFEVAGPDGRQQVGRRPKRGGARVDPFAVPAGQAYSQVAAISAWLDFSEVGRYTVTITFRGTLGQGRLPDKATLFGPGKVSPWSSLPAYPEFRAATSEAEGRQTRVFSLEVLPRDEARLRAVCDALFARADRVGIRDAGDAQDQLGTIRDPLVIPYLEALLAKQMTSAYFEVLSEMGTPAARAALQRLASGPDGPVSRDAQAALLRAR